MDSNNLQEVLDKYGKYVVQQSKSNLTKDQKGGGDLYNSISYEIETEKDLFILDFLMEDYAKFVDEGVSGADPSLVDSEKTGRKGIQKAPYSKFKYKSKKPPLEGLIEWAKRKNIRFRVRKGQKGAGQFKKGSYRDMGFWLQKSIYAQGLKPTYFFSKPFKEGIKDYQLNMAKAFEEDIRSQMIFIAK